LPGSVSAGLRRINARLSAAAGRRLLPRCKANASGCAQPCCRQFNDDTQRIEMSTSTRPTNIELATLVAAARSGDDRAWTQLVDRFDRMLRSLARSYRLSTQDVDEAVQATWVKLYEHIGRVRDASAVGGWLATTVRRESLRLLQSHVREHMTDEPNLLDGRIAGPEAQLLETERCLVLDRALRTLPDRQRRLLTLIVREPDADYEQIGATLDMPVGSIGPIRARSLARLQHHRELREFAAAS
jgi:RNA polymerase sigma factor (sigma-70 family)